MKTRLHSHFFTLAFIGFALCGYGLGTSTLSATKKVPEEPNYWLSITSGEDSKNTFFKKYKEKARTPKNSLRASNDEDWSLVGNSKYESSEEILLKDRHQGINLAQTWAEGSNYARATFSETDLLDEASLLKIANMLSKDPIEHLELFGFEQMQKAPADTFFDSINKGDSLRTLIWNAKQDGKGAVIPEKLLYLGALWNRGLEQISIRAQNRFTFSDDTLSLLFSLKKLEVLEIHEINTSIEPCQISSEPRHKYACKSPFVRAFLLPYLNTLWLPYTKGIEQAHADAIRHYYNKKVYVSSSMRYERPKIQNLNLSYTDIHDDTLLDIIEQLQDSLEEIDVRGCEQLTYKAIGHIYDIFKDKPDQLKGLHIKNAQNITCKELNLSNTNVDVDTLKHILVLGKKHIEAINVSGCRELTRDAVRVIHQVFVDEKGQPEQLKELNVQDAKQITYGSIKTLKNWRPDLGITPKNWETYLSDPEKHDADTMANWMIGFNIQKSIQMPSAQQVEGMKTRPRSKSVDKDPEEISDLSSENLSPEQKTPDLSPRKERPKVSPFSSPQHSPKASRNASPKKETPPAEQPQPVAPQPEKKEAPKTAPGKEQAPHPKSEKDEPKPSLPLVTQPAKPNTKALPITSSSAPATKTPTNPTLQEARKINPRKVLLTSKKT